MISEYFTELLDFQPVWAGALGEEKYARRVTDLSEGRIRGHVEKLRKIQAALASAKPPATWGDARLEFELFRSDLSLRLKEWGEWKKYRQDPSMYVGELIYGLWYVFLRIASKSGKVEAALARLSGARAVLEAARENLKNPPKHRTRLAIDECQGYLGFLREAKGELLRLAPKRRREIIGACAEAESVGKELLQFFRGPLLRRSDGEYAVGRANFEFLLRTYHHYEMTASELRKLGERQFSAVQEQLVEQARSIDPKKPWHRLVEEAKGCHPSAKKLLETYRGETRRLRRFVAKEKIASLPRGERLKVIETPAFTRSTIPFAAYVDPPMFRGKNHGTFFVTPVTTRDPKQREELLGEHNLGAMRVTSLHEGYPGHHLQFAVQRHAPGTMMRIYNCSSFFEGWALYCEEMMFEAGYYDPWGRLIQLKDKLWRACRIIVDVGLHTGGMSDTEAVKFMARELKMSPLSARADVNWYTMRPTVPQSYFTGMLRLRELREKYRQKAGGGFSLQKFHDAVLRCGAIPIPLLEKTLL
ncbi:MAG: DUF885 domain-containing protein [Deltaproteobacteria bacterium]|nr:DUF885 domain-containing protein [Deltaproteobacteria bacterium]